MKNAVIAILAVVCLFLGGKEYARAYLDSLYTQTLASFTRFDIATLMFVRESVYANATDTSLCVSAQDEATQYRMEQMLQIADAAMDQAVWYMEIQDTFFPEESGLWIRSLVLSDYLMNTRSVKIRLVAIYQHLRGENVIEYCISVGDDSVPV